MTTEKTRIQEQSVDSIIKRVSKKTSLLVSVITPAVLVYTVSQGEGRWWFLPASVLFGGALGLLNFRWLAMAVERVYLRKGATAAGSTLAAAVISMLKLSLIFVVLFIALKYRLLQVFGLVGGLSLCFLAVIWEGTTMMKTVGSKQ